MRQCLLALFLFVFSKLKTIQSIPTLTEHESDCKYSLLYANSEVLPSFQVFSTNTSPNTAEDKMSANQDFCYTINLAVTKELHGQK